MTSAVFAQILCFRRKIVAPSDGEYVTHLTLIKNCVKVPWRLRRVGANSTSNSSFKFGFITLRCNIYVVTIFFDVSKSLFSVARE